MTDPIFYSPTQVYINKPANGGVETCKLETYAASYAIGNNQVLIGGVTGKRIRVMGYATQSLTSTQGGYFITNGSGGTVLSYFVSPPSTLPPMLFPITDSGYFETSTGTGLYASVTTASIYFSIFYIVYTP